MLCLVDYHISSCSTDLASEFHTYIFKSLQVCIIDLYIVGSAKSTCVPSFICIPLLFLPLSLKFKKKNLNIEISIPSSPPALNLYEFYFLNLSLLPLLLTAHCLCLVLDFTGFFAGLWQYPWNDLSVSGSATLLLLSSFSLFFIEVFLKCNLTILLFCFKLFRGSPSG